MEITPVQAASLLGKSERTIQRWIQQKKLPARLLTDGSYRVKEEDLEKFMAPQDETLLTRVEALEQKVVELERRLEGINVMLMVRFAETTEIEDLKRRVDALGHSQQ